MRLLIAVSFLHFSVLGYAQTIDWDNFSESRMNEVMFKEMNEYVKRTHHGDSLILSSVVMDQIMTRNHKYIEKHKYYRIEYTHNMEWLGRPYNDLPDSLKTKLVQELSSKYPDSTFIKAHYLKEFKTYFAFTYIEINQEISYGYHLYPTYQEVAKMMIQGWNASPSHALFMNANYQNKVVVGVTTVFDRNTKTIIISFVYVD